MSSYTHNVNILDISPLINPKELKSQLPESLKNSERVAAFRKEIHQVLTREDTRLLVLVGPCSIHDTKAGYDYAQRLACLRQKYSDVLNIVMRVYFEKPRTTIGWRGLIVDPELDESYNLENGLKLARQLLLDIAELDLPAGTEVLDPIIPQYIAGLISWASIGARTTESQIHRELASGLSMPVGFKNGTDGDMLKAINAILSACSEHRFIGINQEGNTCIVTTRGNNTGHVIMRGGQSGPNYYAANIEKAEKLLEDKGILPSIIVDCSHANSGKLHDRQAGIFRAVLKLRMSGRIAIRGLMLESNIVPGRQDIGKEKSALVYGQSITDACIGWEETEELLGEAASLMRRTANLE